MGMEDDFLLEDEDDEKTIEFIKNYLPQVYHTFKTCQSWCRGKNYEFNEQKIPNYR